MKVKIELINRQLGIYVIIGEKGVLDLIAPEKPKYQQHICV